MLPRDWRFADQRFADIARCCLPCSVVGWDFSATPPYWIIKDSIATLGNAFGRKQFWKLDKNIAPQIGFLNQTVGYTARTGPPAPAPGARVAPGACVKTTTTEACKSFSHAYNAAGGAEYLQTLSEALTMNLDAVAGHDVSCLPAGLSPKFCSNKEAE